MSARYNIGDRYHRWLIIGDGEEVKYADNKLYPKVLCRCDCGVERKVDLRALKRGSAKSCGCYRKEVAINNVLPYRPKPNPHPWEWRLFEHFKRGCKSRKISCEISLDDFKEFLIQDCYYCGESPSNVYKYETRDNEGRKLFIPNKYQGIDRVDSKIGYVKENCVPCCISCNHAKMHREQRNFIQWVDKIYNNLKLKNLIK